MIARLLVLALLLASPAAAAPPTLAVAESTFTLTVDGHGRYGEPNGWYATAHLGSDLILHNAWQGDEPPRAPDYMWISNIWTSQFWDFAKNTVTHGTPERMVTTLPRWLVPVGTPFTYYVWALNDSTINGGSLGVFTGVTR